VNFGIKSGNQPLNCEPLLPCLEDMELENCELLKVSSPFLEFMSDSSLNKTINRLFLGSPDS